MNDMSLVGIGHNGGPDPLDAAMDGFDNEVIETALTGQKVENDEQMRQVDGLQSLVKERKKAVDAAKEGEYRPHKNECDRIVKKYAVTIKDLDRMDRGLSAMKNDYAIAKRQAEEAEARKALAEAERLMREAKEAEVNADVSDIDAVREADAKARAAKEAAHVAAVAKRFDTKNVRTFTEYPVKDETGLARWIWQNDREFMSGVLAEYAKRHRLNLPGIVWPVEVRRAV